MFRTRLIEFSGYRTGELRLSKKQPKPIQLPDGAWQVEYRFEHRGSKMKEQFSHAHRFIFGLLIGVTLSLQMGSAALPFESYPTQLDSPARHLADVTPDNSNNLPVACRSLRVAVSGTVKVTTVGGETVTITAVAAGERLPYECVKVFATGTTATGITAEW